jgi:hypothetical protein
MFTHKNQVSLFMIYSRGFHPETLRIEDDCIDTYRVKFKETVYLKYLTKREKYFVMISDNMTKGKVTYILHIKFYICHCVL